MEILKGIGTALLLLVTLGVAGIFGYNYLYRTSQVTGAITSKLESSHDFDNPEKSSSTSTRPVSPTAIVNNSSFATDTQYVYSEGNIPGKADPGSFVALNSRYSKDKYRAYYGGGYDVGAIANADARDFEVLDHSFYPVSTTTNDEVEYSWRQSYAIDKNSVYYNGDPISGADPATFSLLALYYAKDRFRVYFLDTPVEGADPNTFRLIDGGTTFDAEDEAHRYMHGNQVD